MQGLSLKSKLPYLYLDLYSLSLPKNNSNWTYAISNANIDLEKKFKRIISKVRDWKSNFIVISKIVPINIAESESFTSGGFTTYCGNIVGNMGRSTN